MSDQIADLQAQLDAANLQIKDLEARNKESQRRVNAARETVTRVKEGRDRMYLRYAKTSQLLQKVCNDLLRFENADVRAITVCELNEWLHNNEHPNEDDKVLDDEIEKSLKRAAPLLAVLQQVIEMLDHDASVRGHVPQRWETIYKDALEITGGSDNAPQVTETGVGEAESIEQVLRATMHLSPQEIFSAEQRDPKLTQECIESLKDLSPPEFLIGGATNILKPPSID